MSDWLAERLAPKTPTRDHRLAMAAKSEICERLWICLSPPMARDRQPGPQLLSVGGVYVGGGIAPRILENSKTAPS